MYCKKFFIARILFHWLYRVLIQAAWFKWKNLMNFYCFSTRGENLWVALFNHECKQIKSRTAKIKLSNFKELEAVDKLISLFKSNCSFSTVCVPASKITVFICIFNWMMPQCFWHLYMWKFVATTLFYTWFLFKSFPNMLNGAVDKNRCFIRDVIYIFRCKKSTL